MPKQTYFNLPPKKREAIIDGAKQAFARQHYDRVTIDSIVARAGIPKGSFYQYFSGKDDLYSHMFANIGTEKYQLLVQELESSPHGTFTEAILVLMHRASEFDGQDADMVMLKQRFLQECPQQVKQQIMQRMVPESMELFAHVIRRFVGNGEFRQDIPIGQAAYMLTASVLMLDTYPLEEGEDHRQAFKTMVDMLAAGLRLRS